VGKVRNDDMGMSDEQFEVYNALLTFLDELIDQEPDEEKRKAFKMRKKNILAYNKEIK
jgi:flagellar biosynthesis chaperone FliJ